MTTEVAEVYEAMWCPRTDAYADWTDTDGGHWYAVRHPLTPDIVEAALLKKRRPISAYMEDSAGLTHVLAVDIDRDDGWDVGLRLATTAGKDGCHLYPERSDRGCHLWGMVTEQLPGPTVHAALVYWMGKADHKAASDPKVEIMPKPVSRGPDTLGFALRLPMMAHQRTGQWYPLCGMDGQPLGKRIRDILLAVEDTPAEVVRKAAGKVRTPIGECNVPAWARRPAQQAGDVVALLQNAGIEKAAPGRTVRCVLHDDQQASMSISRDSERVWCHAPGCPAHNDGHGLGANQLTKELAVAGYG